MIFLLNVMVGCVVNKILKIFTLELDWQESMMNSQDVNFVVAFKSNLSLMMIKAPIVYIFSTLMNFNENTYLLPIIFNPDKNYDLQIKIMKNGKNEIHV